MNHDKESIVKQLTELKDRLFQEVVPGYATKGYEFGNKRFDALVQKTRTVLDEYSPGESARLKKSLESGSYSILFDEGEVSRWFMENNGGRYDAYIDSLIIDISRGEYLPPSTEKQTSKKRTAASSIVNNKIFIVHGHNGEAKERTARFVSKLGLEPIILHEQVSSGKTIIEKLEEYTTVGFAIVLYTEDDLGNAAKEANKGELNPRARQNVVFEHGLLVGLLTRARVIPIVSGRPELPGDISGMIYIEDAQWQLSVARELKSAGYDIDLNKAFA